MSVSTKISGQTLLEASDTNFTERWLSYGRLPGGEIHGTDVTWFTSGVSLSGYNGVARANLTDTSVDAAIARVIRFFQGRRQSFTWWTGPTTSPTGLGNHLQANGLIHTRDLISMSVDIDRISYPYEMMPELQIETITTPDRLKIWHDLYMQSFNIPNSIESESFKITSASMTAPGTGWRFYLAREEGRPVSASSLFIHGDVAGLYNMATNDAERGRGIGTAMVVKTYEQVRNEGCRIATLQTSNPIAARLYQRLGFEIYCMFGIYKYFRTADLRTRIWRRLKNLLR